MFFETNFIDLKRGGSEITILFPSDFVDEFIILLELLNLVRFLVRILSVCLWNSNVKFRVSRNDSVNFTRNFR